ncbi:unnamed protein product [Mesocestoides corti]|uniref:Uncharacterized protein n=1 Tax=Mesocestoides corti TaxID=53468 RepID=A0A3P6GNW1_MESCO|nr:unnamed protein product [Mesocestoides corti]
MTVDKSYIFAVAAKNSVGQSDFVETPRVRASLPFGVPSCPSNVIAKLVPERGISVDQSVILSWDYFVVPNSTKEPNPEFLVEMKQVDSDRWLSVPSGVPLLDTSMDVPLEMIEEGKSYEFRVAARNKAGTSRFSEPSPSLHKPIDVTFTKELTDIHLEVLPNNVVFECEVSKPGMNLLWFKDGDEIKPNYRCVYEVVGDGPLCNMVQRLTLLNVGPGDQGVFTAQLMNGLTTTARLTIHSPPKINYEGKKLISLTAGKSAVIEVPFAGASTPQVNWSFNGGNLPLGKATTEPMASTETVYGLTSLRLRRVDRSAEGHYLVQVSNELGKAKLELEVRVMDVPQPVENLSAEMVKGEPTSAKVTWEPPKKDGGMPITDYILEKRKGSKRTWTPVGSPSLETIRKVTDLKPGKTYFFRVVAQNSNGWSEPAETNIPLRVEAVSKPPSTPNQPKVEDITSTSCRVTIEPPASDGGVPITFYHLEKRSNQRGNWVRAVKDKIPVIKPSEPHTISITDLVADNVYEFRVAAENADYLTSEFSPPSSRISTKPPFSIPGRPSRPELVIATENSATISWSPPYDNGGDEIKRYVVQYKTTDGTYWATCDEEPIDCQLSITKLQPDSEYEFRVAAINSAGTSDFSHPSLPYTLEQVVESSKPTVSRPLDNITVLVNTPIELECDFLLGEPKATISWLKDNKPVQKFTTSSPTDRHATLRTNRAQLEDAGVFTCKAENSSGSRPLIKLEHPRGSSEKVTGRISDGQLSGFVQGRLVVEAVCEAVPGCEEFAWFQNGQPLEETPRRSIERIQCVVHPKERPTSPIRTRERLIINQLEQSDTGVYRVEAKNNAGRADTTLTLVVTDRPQPPASVNVIKTRDSDSCFIQWQRPLSDGGSKLTQYVVESLIVATDKTDGSPILDGNWTTIGKTSPSELEFKARNLKPGVLYAFRVSAENEVGRSDPTEIDSPIVLQSDLQTPAQPTNVTATRIGAREATVKWQAPESFEKSELIDYVIEMRESPDIESSPPNRWTRIGRSTVRDDTEFHLVDLNPSMDIQFRVLARNHVGLSEPSEPTNWLRKPKDGALLLILITVGSRGKTLPTGLDKVDAGSKDVTDAAPGDKRPKDIVEQLREFMEAIKPKTPVTSELESEAEIPLSREVSRRCVVEQFGDFYYVNLKNLALTDTGRYQIKATNVAGSTHTPFELVVTAPPQTPQGPLEIQEIKPAKGPYDGSSVEVRWKVPSLREGETLETAVTGYVLERKDGKRKDFGRPISIDGPNNCKAVIENLQPGIEYGFKVCAVNAAGVSEPLYSGPIAVKSPFDVPGTCQGPFECTEKSLTSLKLNWKPPKEDGGLPVKMYHLEILEVGSRDGWQPLATVMAPTNSYYVNNLREGIAYRFRVRAVNDQGSGEWLNTDTSISLNRPIGPPSEPEMPLRVVPVDNTSALLSWRPPFDDGGSPISTYIVESNHGKTDEWEELSATKATSFDVTRLLPDDTYTFRVSARNEAGKTGKPIYSVPYKPSSPPTAPGKPTLPFVSHPLESGQMVLDWGPSPVGGASGYGLPTEHRVERWEPVKDRWVYVARKPAAEGTTVLVTGLKPGESYRFRVFAENASGTSEPLEMDKPVLAVSPYSPPSAPIGPMHISEVQKGESVADGSARLSWQEPIDNGGLPLTGYIVQLRYANTAAWHNVVQLHEPLTDEDVDTILPTTTPVTGLKRSSGYYFRVAAINRSGTGPFLESELFEMPEDESCRPKAEWIRVVGKGADSVTVEWLVPHDCRKDHGPNRPHHLALDGFRVYVKDAGNPRAEWKPVTDLDHYMNRLVVGGLNPDKSYYFGVATLNQLGPGEIVSTTEPVSPEAVTTVPGQPVGPLTVSDITQDSCVLSWKAPYSDGGTPISGYTIFKREMFRRSNQEVGRLPVVPGSLQRDFKFKVPYLMVGTSYEFQVVAENKNGFSEPLVTAVDVHPRKMTEPPGAPRGPLYVRDHDIGQVELAWAPPANTGGLPIKGYKLEMREGRSFTWRTYPNEESIVANSPDELANPSVVVSGVKPNKEYFFRISALNDDGCGPPLAATDSYVKRVCLEPPKRVSAKPSSPSETGQYKIEVSWVSPNVPTLNGFTVEMMDTEAIQPEWVPMDFIQKMPNERDSSAYTYRATVPRPKAVYKFRVNATYPEGKSEWVTTDYVLASEATSEPHVLPPISEATFVPSGETPGGRIPATLRWKPPKSGNVESIRGYSVESWDTRHRLWKPVAHVPREAPQELTFELPPTPSTPLMRITTMGDATRSIPFEVPLERAKHIEKTGEIPRDWKPLPSVTGPFRTEYDADEELSMIRTGAATPLVSDFIIQRRQAALGMVRRSAVTPRSAGLDTAPLERFFAETPVIEPLDLRPVSSTPRPLDHLLVTDVGKTTATMEWPERDGQSGFTVERWRPTSGRWTQMAELPPDKTNYVLPLSEIPQTPIPGEVIPRDVWVRVVPRDDQGKPVAPPFQLEKPITIPGGEFVPSSVWGVDISNVGGVSTPGRPIDVSWCPPSYTGGSPLTGYKLRIFDADTDEQKTVFIGPKTTTHRIEGLHPHHEYRISITAVNRVGESLPVTSTVPKPHKPGAQIHRPPAPTSIEFTPVQGTPHEGSCILSWRPGSRAEADSYLVEKWDSRSKQWVPFKKVGANVTEITIPHLLDDVVYTFRVRAQNEAGLSEPGVAKEYYSPGKSPEGLLFPSGKAPPAPPRGPLAYEPLSSQQRLAIATEQATKVMELRWEEPVVTDRFSTPRNYVLEARRKEHQKWAVVGRRPIPEGSRWKVTFGSPPPTSMLLPDIDLSLPILPFKSLSGSTTSWLPGEPKDYEYRLSSENEYGLSEPIYLRPSTMTPLSRPYSPVRPLAPEPPRGPISVTRVFPRPFSQQEIEGPDVRLGLRPPNDICVSWKPPSSSHSIRGYDIAYREPFRTNWTHLGTVDVNTTSFVIPRAMLRGLPETLHLGISSIGDARNLTTPLLSPRLEDTILVPKPTEEEVLPRRELLTPITTARVSARITERQPPQKATNEVELSWVFPEPKRQPKRPEGYIAFYRELGSQQWQEIDRFPAARPKDSVVLRELPYDVTMFVGVAPVTSGRIGQIVSAPDTIRLPSHQPSRVSAPVFERTPLQIRPTSPGGVEVSWVPPTTIGEMLALAPQTTPEYELQVRHPGEMTWRPAGKLEPLESLKRYPVSERPVTFTLHDLHPGDRLELRLLAYPTPAKKPVPVSVEQTYKFVPPYDIPAAPKGPLIVERIPVLPSRLSALSPQRKPAGDFDELLYRLSTIPIAPQTRGSRETPIDTVSLKWCVPEDTGNLPLTHYLIEKRSYGRRGLPPTWVPVMTVPADQTSAHILPDTRRSDTEPAFYRVRAVNDMGPGLPLETIEPITHRGAPTVTREPVQRLPEAPRGPLRAEILPDSRVSLSWKAPLYWPDNGPSRREGSVTPAYPRKYIIEATLADDSTAPWLEVGEAPGSTTATTVRLPSVNLFFPGGNVEAGMSRPILLRVRAENEYGHSAPLTTRVMPGIYSLATLSKLPKLPDAPVLARLRRPQDTFEESSPPSLELEWVPFVPPAITPISHRRRQPEDYSYLVEYRPAGDVGWRHLTTLPLGHERYTFNPPAPLFHDLDHPKSEAYQFRVGVRGPVGVGEFRDSNVVSWTYRRRPSGPVSPSDVSVFSPQAPLDPQLVRARTDTPKEPYMSPTGSITLKWRIPARNDLTTPLSYVVERWYPETRTWRTLGHKLEELGRGVYEATVHNLPVDEPHFVRVSVSGHLGTSEPSTLPYPIWIPNSSASTQPEPPKQLEVSQILRDRPGFLLAWTPPEVPIAKRNHSIPTLPVGYVIEYRSEGGNWKLLADLPAWQTSLETTKVEPGKSYEFRIMSKGQLGPQPARIRRTSLYSETPSTVLSRPTASVPHILPKQSVPVPSIRGLLDVAPTREGVQLSWEPPAQLPSGYIIELNSLDDHSHRWREISRIPSTSRGLPVSSFLVRHLKADKSYRFRMIPYQDDVFGRPVESLLPCRLPPTDDLELALKQPPRAIPPPEGPLTIEELPSGKFRLCWNPPILDSRSPLPGPVMYIIERRIPGRRQWVEISRTPKLCHTVDVDTTSKFRVKAVVSEAASLLRGAAYLIGSDDGPESEWIRFDERVAESTNVISPRRSPEAPAYTAPEIPIPDRFFTRHIGPSSVLLEWDYNKLPDHPAGYLYLEQRLIPDSQQSLVQPLWEPIARIPVSKLRTTYEVTDLLPGRSYAFRLIDKFGAERTSMITREISLSQPIRTRGGELRGASLPKDTEYLMVPRNFSATFNPIPPGGLRFTWLPPESLETQTNKVRYRIEARSVYDSNNAWRLVAKDLRDTEYTLESSKLETLLVPCGPSEKIIKGASADWHFRIIATMGGVDSHPKLLSSPISLAEKSRRKKLCFVNVGPSRDIKCVPGQTLVITFEVDGSPKPSVSWFLNGLEIYPEIDSNYMIFAKPSGVYELRINSIDYVHEGTITCRLRNLYEEVEQSWRIHIETPARFSRTVFLAGQSDHHVVSGGNWDVRLPLDLPYYVTDRPRWVNQAWVECVWKPRRSSPGVFPPAERRAEVRVSECGRWLTLDMPNVRIQDEGLYRIWVENEAGRDYFDLRLHVDDKPRAKLQPPQVYPQGHSQFLLTWYPPSSSEDTITSTGYRIEYISDKQTDKEENWSLLGTTDIGQTEVLIGSQLKTGNRYRFRVRLQNMLGLGPASEPSGFVSVEAVEAEEGNRMPSRQLYFREPIRLSSRKFEDRYEIVEELAKSRHAYIYRIRDRKSGEHRIAKAMILGDLSNIPVSRSYTSLADFRTSVYTPTTRIRHEADEDRRRRAEMELRLLASTHHKNIAELRDVFLDTKRLIWVIDDMIPETLWDRIQSRIRMTESQAAVIMQQILCLLESLHARNLAFLGGVDPGDIFFTDQTHKRIVLGGVSQYHRLNEDKPVRLTFRSTVYVPPELYSSGLRNFSSTRPHSEISRATDVWSAGALLYQMLTGESNRRPNIEDLENLHLSPELIDFSRKLLHPDPSLRPTISEALKHPWITSEHHVTEEIVSKSARRLEIATNNAYRRLLRKIDWNQATEEGLDFVDEMEHDIRRRRRIIEYRKRRRMSLDAYSEERQYGDDDTIAMNVFLRARGRAPKIAVPMKNLDTYEGDETTLSCVLAPPADRERLDLSDVTVEWSVNGKVLDLKHPSRRMSEKYLEKFDRDTGEASLRVRNLSVYDAGTYVATFRGSFGIISESANLKVNRETPRRLSLRETNSAMASQIGAKILRPLVDHTVVAGESLKFRIRVGGIPRPKCTWKRNGLSLDKDGTCRIQEEPVSNASSHSNEIVCTLEIRNTKSSDAGTYSVTVYNKNGSDTSSAVVTVLPERTSGSSMPKFITGLSNITTNTGGTITLEANVQGFPEPQIRWFKDGRLLVVGGRFSTTATEVDATNLLMCRLTITNCQPEDTGAYVCAATSASGTAISEASVVVNCKSDCISISYISLLLITKSVLYAANYVNGTSRGRLGSESRTLVARSHPPEFIQRLKSREVCIGDSVRLSASVTATPAASIVWEKDDIPLVTDSTSSPYQTKATAELGKYTVIAYNSAGESRSSCHLEKAHEDMFKVPRFTRQLVDRFLVSGQKAIFEVIAEGHPMPEFKWEKDGLDLRPDSHPRYLFATSTTSGRATLTIPIVERDDAGLFSCVAHNPVGRDRCSCLIHVDSSGVQQRKPGTSTPTTTDAIKRPPPPPQSTVTPGRIDVVKSLPKVLEIDEGDELRLSCVIKSDIHLILLKNSHIYRDHKPQFPVATWTKGGRTLAFDGRRRITRNLMGEMCLTIDQAMTTDAGRYTLKITPSDATLAETIEPIVLNTRVDVNPKVRTRVRYDTNVAFYA